MENASKALIMAAGVLLGVMIISFAVYLFSTFGSYSNDVYLQMEARRMDSFNSQYTMEQSKGKIHTILIQINTIMVQFCVQYKML